MCGAIQFVLRILALLWVTEFEYQVEPITSLWFSICLSLNKQDTLTGRSELEMQQCQLSL